MTGEAFSFACVLALVIGSLAAWWGEWAGRKKGYRKGHSAGVAQEVAHQEDIRPSQRLHWMAQGAEDRYEEVSATLRAEFTALTHHIHMHRGAHSHSRPGLPHTVNLSEVLDGAPLRVTMERRDGSTVVVDGEGC